MTRTMPDLDVNENSDIYYQGGYWNDFEIVAQPDQRADLGGPGTRWHEHFAKRRRSGPSSGR